MSRARLFDTVLDATGRPVVGASVAVYQPNTTTPIAETLYADNIGGTTVANPLMTGADGSFLAYIDVPRRVDLFISAVGITSRTVPDVGLFPDPADIDLPAHEADADPHGGYQLRSEKNALSGYPGLTASGFVLPGQLGSGTPDGTKYLRDDGVWNLPPGTSPTTTRGDIIKRGAAVDERLAIGTVGQGLFVTDIGAGVLEPRYATPAFVKLGRQVLGAPAASVTFSSIPGTFGGLVLKFYVRSDAAGIALTPLYLRFNADSGSNYDRQVLGGAATSAVASESLGVTVIELSSAMPAATATANKMGAGFIDIPDYASTVGHKSLVASVYMPRGDTTGLKVVNMVGGEWRNTAAITSITLLPGAGNFITGSTFALYGLEA